MTRGNASHVLPLPEWTIALRILQLVVALAVLGLAGYGLYWYSFDGIDLTTFVAIATIIITLYIILATMVWPVMYNYWAILGLDVFAIIFWLVSFALLASEVNQVKSTFSYYYDPYSSSSSSYSGSNCATYYGYTYCVKKRDVGVLTKRSDVLKTYYSAMAAAAGLGGLEFVLFIATLVLVSIHLHRHRRDGGRCTTAGMGAASNTPGYTGSKPEDLRPETTA